MSNIIIICLIYYILSILQTDANVPHTAPQFTVEPKDKVVTTGKPATLSCRATGNPAPRYAWRRNGMDIVFATGAKERLLSNGDLYISEVDKSHIGRYQCVVKVIYSAIRLTIISRTATLKLAGEWRHIFALDFFFSLWLSWISNYLPFVSYLSLTLSLEWYWYTESRGKNPYIIDRIIHKYHSIL